MGFPEGFRKHDFDLVGSRESLLRDVGSRRAGDKIRREDELPENVCVYLLLEKNGSTALGQKSLASWVHLRNYWPSLRAWNYSGREVWAKPGTEHKGGTDVGIGIGTRDGNQRDTRYWEKKRQAQGTGLFRDISHQKGIRSGRSQQRSDALMKGYRNTWLRTQRKYHQQLWNQAANQDLDPGPRKPPLPGAQRHLDLNILCWIHGWTCQSFLQTSSELSRIFPFHMHGNISMTMCKRQVTHRGSRRPQLWIQGLWTVWVTVFHCSGCSTEKDKNDCTSLICWMAWKKERAPPAPALNSL